MNKNRDLRECLSRLRGLHLNKNLKPEQTSQIEIIIERVKGLARKKNPTQAEIFACVKEVTERWVRIFLKK